MDSRSAPAASARSLGVAALIAVLSLGPALSGCGEDERDAVRERVDAYIESEREVMRRAEPDLVRANQTYIAYSKGELELEHAAERVSEAQRAIRNARDGVLVLNPPAEARPLHERLLRYLDLNVDLARETSRLVTYVPAAVAALTPVDRVNRQLESRLSRSEDGSVQARELESFQASVAAIVGDLRALKPPPVLVSTHRDQLRRLEATRRLAARLRRALLAQDAVKVSRLLKRFRGDAARPAARRRLANQAVAQYSRRLDELNEAGAAVLEEQRRLARSLR